MVRREPAFLVGLDRLLDERWSRVEADFARCYGMDLRRCVYGPAPLGARRLLVLVQGLPIDATMRDPVEWTIERELAASQIEVTHEVVRMLLALMRMWADKSSRSRITIPRSLHVPRPYEQSRAEDTNDDDEWPPRMRSSGRDITARLMGRGD